MPRATRTGPAGLRVLMDAAMLASCSALVLWAQLIGPAVHHRLTAVSGFALASTTTDVLVLAIFAVSSIREGSRTAWPVIGALVLHTMADTAFTMTGLTGPRVLPLLSAVAWAVAWPLACVSIVIYPTRPGGQQDSDRADRRESHVAAGSTAVAMALVIASMTGRAGPPTSGTDGGVAFVLVGIVGIVGVARESIAAALRMQLVRSLKAQAFEEPLTGLANRRALTQRIVALRPGTEWVVVTLDVDGFKQVNDLLGHAAGDQALIQVGRTLSDGCPPSGLAARIGGDEFAVLAPGGTAEGEALAARLLAGVRDALDQPAGGMTLSASAGVGLLGPERDRLNALVESSAALRAAKTRGRGQVGVFTEELARERERLSIVERRLIRAVAERRIGVAAQPIVSLATGRTGAVEALARWTDDELGVVGPDEFIPVAESSGLIPALGRQVLCAAVATARAEGLFDAGIRVGVNVSPLQLLIPDFVPLVRALLDENGLDGDRLILEVTEAILVAEDDDTMRALAQLKDLGVALAIDDFGSGYSALSYLRRLPVDVVKIDRSWTVASMTDERTRNIVGSVNALAHKLGAYVVMEGIEDEATAQMSREVGADMGQGWHFGRPTSCQAVMASMAAAGLPGA
jgi:diguanylate cyclase (GGDEF)-like protein